MKIRLLKIILQKFIVLIVAIQIIDLSIDAIDFQPIESVATIGDFNYFNSVIEYVTESLLGHTNAFPEYQNEPSSSKKAQLEKAISFKFSQTDGFDMQPKFLPLTIKANRNYDEDFYSFYYSEIIPPPPKA